MTPEHFELLNNLDPKKHIEWLSKATEGEIDEHLKTITGTNHFRELALQERSKRLALKGLTLSNQSLELMGKLNTQTERLIGETVALHEIANAQIQLAERLDIWTKVLVWLTVGLLILTTVLVGDALGLYHHDTKPTPQKTESSSSALK